MARSMRKFDRWIPREPSSWPFQVFQKYNAELGNMLIAYFGSQKYTYKQLGKTASWDDLVSKHFEFSDETHEAVFKDIRSWSLAFNEFDNWTNLNSIMAMSSYFETYIATAIKLALESDVGVLFGVNRKIDGIQILKHGHKQPFDFEDKINGCTKGHWSSRVDSYKKIFGHTPEILSDNISALEKIRALRNNLGHAFGRDINESRRHEVISITKMQSITREKTIHYQSLLFGIAKKIDKHLLANHIGEYQALHFYHNLRPNLKQNDSIKERQFGNHVAVLKKKIGRFGAASAGKEFCKGLIEYYEAL